MAKWYWRGGRLHCRLQSISVGQAYIRQVEDRAVADACKGILNRYSNSQISHDLLVLRELEQEQE